jgi:aminoglycoside-2''-adenylyltransferase
MSERVVAPGAEEQLAAIASLSRVLDHESIDYWLFGGWAVDFWVGRVTREHDDIDVAAWRTDYEAIGNALQAAGWRHTPVADEVVGTRYQWGTAEVEFTFMTADPDGQVVIPLPDNPVVWSADPLGNERRQLGGVNSRTIPLALLKAGKSSTREGSAEAAKDRSDAQALCGLEP